MRDSRRKQFRTALSCACSLLESDLRQRGYSRNDGEVIIEETSREMRSVRCDYSTLSALGQSVACI